MQNHDELEPTVRIRELKKDRVNFVLENVDLAYALVVLFVFDRLTIVSVLQIHFGESSWRIYRRLVRLVGIEP